VVAEPGTRERILTCASMLYAEDGLVGFSMRKIADKVGVSAAALYRHYEDKEALLMAICEEGFRIFGNYLFQALHASTPLDRLHETGEGYLQFALGNPHYYRVIFMTPVESFGWKKLPEGNQDNFSSSFQFLIDRVRECIDAKVLREGDPTALSFTIWAHVHGLVSLRLAGHVPMFDEQQFSEIYRSSIRQVVSGLMNLFFLFYKLTVLTRKGRVK
jgi:AcrR family transcriptional regulator